MSTARRLPARVWATVFPLLLAVVCFAAPARAEGGNLLAGLSPVDHDGVRCVDCLTDGVAAREGSFWKTTLATRFVGRDAYVVYDLGKTRAIRAAWLQGDNNDGYHVQVSEDGKEFKLAWRADKTRGSGLRQRFSNKIEAEGRFIRVWASGGDGSYALTELQLFEEAPAAFPPEIPRVFGYRLDQNVRTKTLLFGLALIAWLALTFRRARWWWVALTALAPLYTTYDLVTALGDAWPPGSREVSLVRATVVSVAGVAILREFLLRTRFAASRPVVFTTLGVCAVTAFLAFYNLGQPQFYHQKESKPTFVHYWDLRQYYTTAKYFPEIGYRDIYNADVAAYIEDDPNVTLDNIERLPMRNLRNLQMSNVAERRMDIERVKDGFTPERWEEFKKDSAYFREAMGKNAFLETMHDMGGNATPVWISIAHVLFNTLDLSDSVFLYTGLLDPLLLLAAFIAIGFTFGFRTMLVCMVVFGANDFIMYGTNWGGATLRHDWMAYLGLGACAIKREKWVLGGVLFGLSTMIRAFPALAIVGVTFPMGWWIYEFRRREKKFPGLGLIRKEHKPVERILIGAGGTIIGFFLLTTILFPPETWVDWLSKVGQLSGDPHANHISLRSFIAGWEGDQWKVLAARRPLFIVAVAFFVVMVIAGARRCRPEQAAILSLVLIPVFFYPANYYIHFVFLLPLLVVETSGKGDRPPLGPTDVWILGTLTIMCAAQYFTVLVREKGIHFYMSSTLLFAAVTSILFAVLLRERVTRIWELAMADGGAAPAEAPSSKAEEEAAASTSSDVNEEGPEDSGSGEASGDSEQSEDEKDETDDES